MNVTYQKTPQKNSRPKIKKYFSIDQQISKEFLSGTSRYQRKQNSKNSRQNINEKMPKKKMTIIHPQKA